MCREKGFKCTHPDPILKAFVSPLFNSQVALGLTVASADKSQRLILEGIAELKSIVKATFSRLDERISNEERSRGAVVGGPKLGITTPTLVCGPSPEPVMWRGNAHAEPAVAERQQTPQLPTQHKTPVEGMGRRLVPGGTGGDPLNALLEVETEDNDMREPSGLAVRPGPPSIPVDHTTSAGLLLTWPSIKKLTAHLLKCEDIFPEDFPQLIEESRGILKLFGGGEGHGQCHALTADCSRLDVNTDTLSESGSSPAAGQGDWGQLGSLSPVAPVHYKSSALTSWGQPDYNEATVWRYIDSCRNNVLNLHPIVPKSSLNLSVKRLLHLTALKEPQPPQPNTTIGKRKRSPTGGSVDELASPMAQPGQPSRTIDQAIVLAALALGKLSLHRRKILDVSPSESRSYDCAVVSISHPVSAFPAQTSRPSPCQSSGLALPAQPSTGWGSRRSSWQTQAQRLTSKTAQSMNHNYDSIPGLEYLALATDILGNQDGAMTIEHVQANILVALYYGQIGYVVQSFKYINNASWTLQAWMCRHVNPLIPLRTAPFRHVMAFADRSHSGICHGFMLSSSYRAESSSLRSLLLN